MKMFKGLIAVVNECLAACREQEAKDAKRAAYAREQDEIDHHRRKAYALLKTRKLEEAGYKFPWYRLPGHESAHLPVLRYY